MLVLVIGCGKFGRNIAIELDHAGHDIAVVDKVYQNFASLPESFRGKRINGDAMVKEVLQRAKADEAQALVLTMNQDTDNLVLARLFKEVYQLENIIAVNADPAYRFYYDLMGIKTISMLSWGTLKVEELLATGHPEDKFAVGTTDVGVYNVKIPEDTPAFSSLDFQRVPSCLIFAITHADVTYKFTDSVQVQPGDVLHVSASAEGLQNLYAMFGALLKGEEK